MIDVEDLQADVVALMYYIYRQQGYPQGDSLQGLIDWVHLNVKGPFERLAELDGEEDKESDL